MTVKTTTTLQSSHNPVPFGQGFSVSAHIDGHVHGEVGFTADGEHLGTVMTDSTGVAVVGVPGGLLHPGEHTIIATFMGDALHEASTSEPLTVTLLPAEGMAMPEKPPLPANHPAAELVGETLAPPAPETAVEHEQT